MNPNLLATDHAEALARLASIARRKGVSPDEFRARLVHEFVDDLTEQVRKHLDFSMKLVEAVSLVSPERGGNLADAFGRGVPELNSLCEYLAHLNRHPLDWPSKQ
ncbi:hypothetical protein AB3K78_09175 [Leucobacter sp. HNU]|uniref:hypothetical protein n=1 Tax=Leucobacter sp. HNU TaxID=3236805 RepID=UPI003A8132F2